MRSKNARVLVLSLLLANFASLPVAFAGGGPRIVVRAAGPGESGVAMVQTYNCGTPTAMNVTAVAERIEHGALHTRSVQLKSAGAAGLYTVERPWADAQPWVLRVSVTKGWTVAGVARFDAQLRFVSYDDARDVKAADKLVAAALASAPDAH